MHWKHKKNKQIFLPNWSENGLLIHFFSLFQSRYTFWNNHPVIVLSCKFKLSLRVPSKNLTNSNNLLSILKEMSLCRTTTAILIPNVHKKFIIQNLIIRCCLETQTKINIIRISNSISILTWAHLHKTIDGIISTILMWLCNINIYRNWVWLWFFTLPIFLIFLIFFR